MSLITHPFLGLPIGDPGKIPLSREKLPSFEDIRLATQELILSPSGWRKIFAKPELAAGYASWDYEQLPDNSLSPLLAPTDMVIVAGMALVFSSFIKEHCKPHKPSILLGIDTRPTSPAIADIFARVLIGEEYEVRYLFIVPIPEITAYAAHATTLDVDNEFHSDGFVYVSASHNPPGYNGIKFGLGGGVLTGEQIRPLISDLKLFLSDPESSEIALMALEKADSRALTKCYENVAHWKRYSQSAYMLFAHRVFTDEETAEAQERILLEIAEACEKRPFGIIAELNGSARTQSIDLDWLSGIGVQTRALNIQPGVFAHRIVPENESLDDCRKALQLAHNENAAYALGYVPDCDGDRGNLVYYGNRLGEAIPLEAQQVFALACLSELAYMQWKGEKNRIAIVVNDATSMRIEAIARVFGAKVFRTETGEANVVCRAEKLRAEGWTVRILGEGSNGGNITHPSKVRDPLSTIGSIIRLLRLGDAEKKETCFNLWLEAIDSPERYQSGYNLEDVIESLPQWITTSAFEPHAALKIHAVDKIELKKAYQRLFLEEWPKMLPELEQRFDIVSWRAFASLGPDEFEVESDFGSSKNGGLRIVLYDKADEPRAFLWMRASGTEPVFRIEVDIKNGTCSDEAWLRRWHAGLVTEADLLAAPRQNNVG